MKFLFLFILLFSCGESFAQSAGKLIDGTIANGVYAPRNYVKNSSGFKNTLGITVSNATIARDTDTADKLDGIASLVCDASAQNGYCLWSLDTIQEGDKTGNCEFKVTYKGDASLYKLRITDTSSTLTDSSVLSNVTDWTESSINYPCGSARDVRLVQTESGTGAAVNVGRVYYGKATNIGTSPGIASTVQKFLSGSGTYTTPTNVLYIMVTMVGGGGGGRGSGTTPGSGGAGGDTTFSGSTYTASGGAGDSGNGGVGGAASGGSINIPGGDGSGRHSNDTSRFGGNGGSSFFGGAGLGGTNAPGAGSNGKTNSGGGGGGAGNGGTALSGGGGGAGGYVNVLISSPSATYSYAVGAAGTAGTAGTSGAAGGAGGSGMIIVEEYYRNSSTVGINCIGTSNCENVFSATVGSTGTVSAENVDWINGNCTNANPLVCTFNTSLFSATPSCTVTAATGLITAISAISTSSVSIQGTSDAGAATQYGFHIICSRQSSDLRPRPQVPILVGSVSSLATGAEGICRLRVANSGSASITSQSGDCIASVNRTGTGTVTNTFKTGYFSAAPTCVCVPETTSRTCMLGGAPSTTSVVTSTQLPSTVTEEDRNYDLICIGPR